MGNVNEYKGQGRKYRRVMRRVVGRRASVQYYSSAGSGRATAQYGKGSASGSATGRQADSKNLLRCHAEPERSRYALNYVLNVVCSANGRKLVRVLFVAALLGFFDLKLARPANAGFLDVMQTTVQNATTLWMNNTLAIGQTLFGIIMTVTIVMALCRYAATNGTLEGVGHSMMSLLLNLIPVFVIMTAMTAFLPNIVAVANSLAGQITGVQVNGPSEIFGIGITLCQQILQSAAAPFLNPANTATVVLSGPAAWAVGLQTMVLGVLTCIIVMGAFTLIAAEYLLCFLQAYIRLSIEAWNLGWSASSGTKHFAEAFIGEAKHALTRVILTIGIVAFIVAMVPHMTSHSTVLDFKTIVMSWFELAGTAAFCAILAIKVPHLAHSGGQPSLSAPRIANEALSTASSGVSRIVRAAKAS